MGAPGNVFLIGPMGVGKSTIGRHLAELMKYRFFDSDHEIEKRTGANIPLIFEIEGEAGFRKRESCVIEELSRHEHIVLATGGGAVLSPVNREVLRRNGFVVYLQADIDTLLDRTRRDRHRPLLQTENPRQKFEELMKVREPLYRETADLVVTTNHRSPAIVAREIVAKLSSLRPHENAQA